MARPQIGASTLLILLGLALILFLAYGEAGSIFGAQRIVADDRTHSDPPLTPFPSAAPVSCAWEFERYISSPYELEWEANILTWRSEPCNIMRQAAQVAKSDRWLNYTNALNHRTWDAKTRAALHDELGQILGEFRYRRKCDGAARSIWIEPIAGLTRHPGYCLGTADVVDKSYLLIDPEAESLFKDSGKYTEALYFDAGASSYYAGGGGASQSWIVDSYANRGIQFDDILAWEYTKMDPEIILNEIPPVVRPHYHWYNIPVSAEEGHPNNPIFNMKALARPTDFVVFKIDIDTPSLEEPIVYQLLNDTVALSLVDDMFFEHHVNVRDMHAHWGSAMTAQLDASYAMFLSYRRKGVRIHSWV